MEKWKNIKLDDESMWPKEGLVQLEPPHSDDRGKIQSLVNFPMKNISLICFAYYFHNYFAKFVH